MRSNYKPLGKYIQPVVGRNDDLGDLPLVGLSIQKKFIPSIANTIGTDMTTYRIIEKNQFAYGPVTSRNGDKITIALFNDFDKALISQAYTPFEVKDNSELDPEYLMMWFRRPEFDRYARFKSHGSAREIFDWEEMCNTLLPVPHIDKQREIVKEYNVIQNRINLNQQLIQKLEETAQAIYREWFVEFEFPDENGKPYKSNGGEMVWNEELGKEIPKVWVVSNLDSEFKITIGRTPPRIEEEWFRSTEDSIDWVSIKDMANCDTYIFETNEKLTNVAVKKFSIPKIPINTTMLSFKMTVGKLAITTKEMLSNEAIAHFGIKSDSKLTTEFIYCFLDYFKFNALGTTSSIVDSINTKMIKEIKILVPQKGVIMSFDKVISNIFLIKKMKERENQKLTELKDLLLSKLATIEN
jgi:type I restriction enzyme S subunit